MRTWVDILFEAIEPTDYGYWIDPKGKIIPVANQQHAEVVGQLTQMTSEAAMQAGWVRVIAYCDWLAVAFRNHLTPTTARAVKKLAQRRWGSYTLDWQHRQDGQQHGDRVETPNRIAFLAAVDDMAKSG